MLEMAKQQAALDMQMQQAQLQQAQQQAALDAQLAQQQATQEGQAQQIWLDWVAAHPEQMMQQEQAPMGGGGYAPTDADIAAAMQEYAAMQAMQQQSEMNVTPLDFDDWG